LAGFVTIQREGIFRLNELLEKEEQLISYLLRDMSEAERKEIAQQFFADDELFEQLLVVENDLIDRYARGKLSAEKERLFEQSYLTTQPRRNRVATAKALIQTATESRVAKKNSQETKKTEKLSLLAWLRQPVGGIAWARGVVAALILFAVLIVVILLWMNRNQKSNEIVETPPKPSPSISPTPDNQPSPSPLNEENKNTPEKKTPDAETQKPLIATLLISGNAGRDGGTTPTATIYENTSAVRLQIKIKDTAYSSYSVTVRRASGTRDVWTQENLEATKGLVATTIPSQNLSQGDFLFVVEGKSDDGTKEIVKEGYFKIKISK